MRSGYPISNGLAPESGPKGIRIDVDISTKLSVDFDLATEQQENQIDFIQSIFVDNRKNSRALQIDVVGIPFQLVIPNSTCGVFPFIHSGAARFTVSCANVLATPIPLWLLNVPQPYILWQPGT